jgi:hypothetical protein
MQASSGAGQQHDGLVLHLHFNILSGLAPAAWNGNVNAIRPVSSAKALNIMLVLQLACA